MSETPTVAGINYQDLTLVRVQGGLDGVQYQNGALVLNRSGSGRADSMNTAHFTLNSIVQNHALGTQFDGSDIVIISPLDRAIREGGNTPSGLSAGDTWIHADAQGKINLPGARILAPNDAVVPPELESLVTRYPRGNTAEETTAKRNRAVADSFERMNVPLKRLMGNSGTDTLLWAGTDRQNQTDDLTRFAQQMLAGREVAVGALHMDSPDGRWEMDMSRLRQRISNHAGGQRLEASDTGLEREIFPIIKEQIAEMGKAIDARITSGADPKAIEFYRWQLGEIVERVNTVSVPQRRREVATMLGDGYYYSNPEQTQRFGPVTGEQLVTLGANGGLNGSLIWQQGMKDWERYDGSDTQRRISTINTEMPSVLAVTSSIIQPIKTLSQIDVTPSALQDFLATPADPEVFAKAAWQAAVEIAKADGVTGFKQQGTIRIDRRADSTGWVADWEPHQLQNGLTQVAGNWQENNRAIFFRGSKLPDAAMGSFGFAEDGVHLAPQLHTALGYATSVNQDYTDIGKLLRFDVNKPHDSFGFLSTWEIPLDHPVWKNFEYEEFAKGSKPASAVTVGDALREMQRITSLPSSDFERGKLPEGGTTTSLGEQEAGKLFTQISYEAISPKGSAPTELYLCRGDSGLIRINTADPKWGQWMARVQEASIRHFYEIAPLEGAIKELEYYKSSDYSPLNAAQKEMVATVQEEARKALELAKSKPWTSQTLEQAKALSNAPWIAESSRVGSSTGQAKYPPHIERILAAKQEAIFGEPENVARLLHARSDEPMVGSEKTVSASGNKLDIVSATPATTKPNSLLLTWQEFKAEVEAQRGKDGARPDVLDKLSKELRFENPRPPTSLNEPELRFDMSRFSDGNGKIDWAKLNEAAKDNSSQFARNMFRTANTENVSIGKKRLPVFETIPVADLKQMFAHPDFEGFTHTSNKWSGGNAYGLQIGFHPISTGSEGRFHSNLIWLPDESTLVIEKVKSHAQGKGNLKNYMAGVLQLAERIGAKRIELGAENDGSLVWPKTGIYLGDETRFVQLLDGQTITYYGWKEYSERTREEALHHSSRSDITPEKRALFLQVADLLQEGAPKSNMQKFIQVNAAINALPGPGLSGINFNGYYDLADAEQMRAVHEYIGRGSSPIRAVMGVAERPATAATVQENRVVPAQGETIRSPVTTLSTNTTSDHAGGDVINGKPAATTPLPKTEPPVPLANKPSKTHIATRSTSGAGNAVAAVGLYHSLKDGGSLDKAKQVGGNQQRTETDAIIADGVTLAIGGLEMAGKTIRAIPILAAGGTLLHVRAANVAQDGRSGIGAITGFIGGMGSGVATGFVAGSQTANPWITGASTLGGGFVGGYLSTDAGKESQLGDQRQRDLDHAAQARIDGYITRLVDLDKKFMIRQSRDDRAFAQSLREGKVQTGGQTGVSTTEQVNSDIAGFLNKRAKDVWSDDDKAFVRGLGEEMRQQYERMRVLELPATDIDGRLRQRFQMQQSLQVIGYLNGMAKVPQTSVEVANKFARQIDDMLPQLNDPKLGWQKYLDSNGDGKITRAEVLAKLSKYGVEVHTLSSNGINLSVSDLTNALKAFGVDRGETRTERVGRTIQNTSNVPLINDEVHENFSGRTGYGHFIEAIKARLPDLEKLGISSLLGTQGKKLTLDDITNCFKQNGIRVSEVDRNGDGQITAGEVVQSLQSRGINRQDTTRK